MMACWSRSRQPYSLTLKSPSRFSSMPSFWVYDPIECYACDSLGCDCKTERKESSGWFTSYVTLSGGRTWVALCPGCKRNLNREYSLEARPLCLFMFSIYIFQICRIRALLGVGSVSACAFVCLRHCPKGLQYELAKSWLSDVWERILRDHVEQRSDEMEA